MYRYKKARDGYAAGLYRTPEQIKRDMDRISECISDVMYMLNVRNLVSEVISESSIDDVARRAEAVGELVENAREALSHLQTLECELEQLRGELADSVAIIGRHTA